MDYWVCAGNTPAEIIEQYTEVTGKVPMMPDYAMGFWQCKLRYQTQDELLDIAREYKRRGLPLDLIVADFFHWEYQGDWKFDPEYWPDPKAMLDELNEMGVKLMVSVWPTVDARSENYQTMLENGYLIRTERGIRYGMDFMGATIHITRRIQRRGSSFGRHSKRITTTTAYAFSGWTKPSRNIPYMISITTAII